MLLVPGILGLLCSAPVWGESQPLALPQLVDYALQNNGELNALRAEKGSRDAAKIRAGLLPNPTLELDAATGALTGSSAENSLSIGFSQELLLAGKRDKRRAIAEQEMESYRWQLADRERVLAEEVKTAFYDVVLAEQRLTLADRFIALNRQLLEVTNERLLAGDIPELELNLVKVELARSEGAKIDVEKSLQQRQSRLWTLMGLPRGESRHVAGNLDNKTQVTGELADLKQLAQGKRPDLKALAAEKVRGDAELVLADAESIPNLTAGIALKRDTTAMEIGGVEGKDTAYTLGLKLSIPIPVFDRNQAGVQEARARQNSAASRWAAAVNSIERDVATAYLSYRNTEKVLGLYRSNILPQLEENLKLTQEAYRLGELGILSVIQEQKLFFEVNDSYLTALHDRQTALVKLESAVATDLTGGVQ
nr:TolC family protein [Geoanaerobacter pelophilus]